MSINSELPKHVRQSSVVIKRSCCTPSRPVEEIAQDAQQNFLDCTILHLRNCKPVPGGDALLGTAYPLIAGDGESPLLRKKVRPLWWECGATSIGQFKKFVDATKYVTVAESLGWSFVFYSHVPGGAEGTLGVEGLEWWRRIEGANWRYPNGPEGAEGSDEFPATHIALEDANAFAKWAGGRLPREVEWEHAARGGLGDVRYPWGNTDPDDLHHLPCNIWQGVFPVHDTGLDGYSGPAPVLSFDPNGYGLHHMVGNVWEWTADPFKLRSVSVAARRHNASDRGRHLLKGGSFLCHQSYCHRYRIAARTGNTPDSTSSHTGFRVVYDSAP
ncbi:formylglycine-generating enzyme family protein [Ahrensia kielensis]|uniref:Formylglycine-generating enzyme family protein n=1 Tax=Ahrensia kielensis TaxID=76980 RepID=A0ABU9TAE1_9HYPH